MKRVIITGATGSIGVNFINLLLKDNIEITAIIRENSNNRELLPNNDNLKIIECNLDDLDKVEGIEGEYDVFYHMAWDGTRGSTRDDVNRQLANVEYTLNAIRLAKRINCKKFIGTGSQAEYGRVEGKISHNTVAKPETAYGITKLCAAQLGSVLAKQLGIDYIWVRIMSIYGPYDGENTMIMSSIREMLKGVSPNYTKAEQMWDYLYVEDMVRALELIGMYGKSGSIYCVGSGKQHSLKEYIEEIRNQINPTIKLKIGALEYSENQVMNLCADISNLVEDTGFKPEIDFREGIKRTIDWYKENIKDEKN